MRLLLLITLLICGTSSYAQGLLELNSYGEIINIDLQKEVKLSQDNNSRTLKVHDPKYYQTREWEEVAWPTLEEILSEIETALYESKGKNYLQRLHYAYKQSMSGENMDFLGSFYYTRKTLIEFDGYLYENHDFGNFVWGMAMYKLRIDYWDVFAGSQVNALLFASKQNTGKEIKFELDSKADQQAIKRGYFYLENMKKKQNN